MELLVQQLQSITVLPDEHLRLFHGRGHCYAGLESINIDWFKPVVWVVVYGEQEEHWLEQLREALIHFAEQQNTVQCVVLQQRIRGRAQQAVIYGELPQENFAQEGDMRFHLEFEHNQNIGFFPDAKPARQWAREQSAGKRVLNLFAYTCSFSVAALKGGAQSVLNMDMAKGVLAVGQRNHVLNQLDMSKVQFLPHDVFRSTRKLEDRGPYDVIILDPPSRQKGSFEADKDYGRLLRRLKPMLAEGGQVLACLNAPYLPEDFLVQNFAENWPELQFQQRLEQRPDFPEQDLNRCLKMQIFA